jgi:ElaB/YqjD/DUF883 family membrane-anchored ribosome-binding protein
MEQRFQDQVNKAQEVLEEGRRAVGDMAKTASESSVEAFRTTDEWVHRNPWTALGMVAAVGLILGLAVASASRRDH